MYADTHTRPTGKLSVIKNPASTSGTHPPKPLPNIVSLSLRLKLPTKMLAGMPFCFPLWFPEVLRLWIIFKYIL